MPYKIKSSGQWMAQVTIGGKKAGRHRCKTKKEATEWEREERKRLLQPEVDPPIRTVSLHEWATAYLDYAKARFVQSTYEEKRHAFRQLFSFIVPDEPAEGLSSQIVLGFLQSQAGKSGNSANKRRKNLRAAWAWGMVFLGLPDKNPFDSVPRFSEVRDERSVPTIEDFWKVYAVADTAQDQLMLFMLLHTGARRDELFRCRWKDIDLAGRKVRLFWRKNAAGEWKEAWLPIGGDLSAMLERHRKVTGLLGHVFMWQSDDGSGKWLPYQYRQHWLKKLCAKAGVKQFGFHGIRHLFASILAGKNVPLVEIQKMLRHGSIQTTARYIHSLQDGSREALDALPGLSEGSGDNFNLEKSKERKVM